jgi:genome maintenance protein MGM101
MPPEAPPALDGRTAPPLTQKEFEIAKALAAAAPAQAPATAPPKPRNALPQLPQEIDWVRSFHGISEQPFSERAADILSRPLNVADIEVKPDGIVYLPEIKYRRILNAAFGPGGWAMVPRGDPIVRERIVTREYALIIGGRYVLSFLPQGFSC